MIILGIDPGTRRIGYGLVEGTGNKTKFIEAGLLEVRSNEDVAALKETKEQIEKLIKRFRPEAMAIEKLFFMKNQKTAMKVAEARGVAILAAAENGLKILEYSPNEVKAGVTGYGLADKKAVSKMVSLILGESDLKIIDDASDALAIAIMGCYKRQSTAN
ncbi:MAG: crossover junction endodeoxyribonuclease RuvC [Patescibacteria group bacterium]|nr:crossover junction endodeoxyribonuclease RuvC [Patescibacteria group bacterium]MDE2015142.1 crossover junction endodeoxyribonuclease RuvC [Patescibacteria group bacterium]MDE2226570.1 crossover junction endodeoxyribonuclease RuvC [Patescibacteria group bacterium]